MRLNEYEWNFHFGSEHNGRPYVSDNKYRMAGRETGHFGSGTYFSTYRENEVNRMFGDKTTNFNPNFIKIGDNVYRVDFDLYKNLYRVRSKKQGDILYTMMANLNHMFNRIAYMGHFSQANAYYKNAGLYQEIKTNADALGLRCPSYYELTRMAQRHGMEGSGIQSFSTLFMEWNGYNGVNVSGIDYYDNTKHGSVIYDLSKTDTEMEEVKPKSLYTGFKQRPYDDTVARRGFEDPEIESLQGEYIGWYNELNNMSPIRALRILKNYTDSGHILNCYNIKNLKPELIRRYLRLIYTRNPRDSWGGSVIDDVVLGEEWKGFSKLIEQCGAYYWVNYESKKGSVLVSFLSEFEWKIPWDADDEKSREMKEDYLKKLMSYMKRDLTKYEKEFIEEDYFE